MCSVALVLKDVGSVSESLDRELASYRDPKDLLRRKESRLSYLISGSRKNRDQKSPGDSDGEEIPGVVLLRTQIRMLKDKGVSH